MNIWGDSVKLSYGMNGAELPDYIARLNGSTRQYYKNDKTMDEELILGLIKERL